ncbi:sigma-70 family RNA polymerase sigma factor [Patulibacter minatonensis]|uniref:sigma-70 family RNA polymerase sigma factor n=1 Tax=Patulibacter minatonensis TaxID=298163 RepID=UPI00047EA8AC|nr:sigma-70 family RNA polymerase sigma factor [Patulibacter minatonensis]
MSPRPSSRDDALLARLTAQDEGAWEQLDRRYRPALRRWAASLSRPGQIDPDDIVQDVLLRAHHRLSNGFAPDHLSAWLHRMVRNATIDAIRAHAHRATEPLRDDTAHVDGSPDVLIVRKERLRRLIDDVAKLPDPQRRALVAVAVDDRPVDDVADELGISGPAVRMAVRRARENLVRTEEARDATCDRIRTLLHDAHDQGRRPSEHARLHLQHCAECREYRKALRRSDRRLRILVPPVVPLAGLLGGGGATIGVVGKSVVAGVVVLAVATGGVVVEREHHRGPGDPSPVTLPAGFVSDREVRRGGSLPPGAWAVTARVRLPAGRPPPGQPRAVVLHCPRGTRAAGFINPPNPRSFTLMVREDPRRDLGGPDVRLRFENTPLRRPQTARVGVLCRRPDHQGSLELHPRRTRHGETAMITTAGRHYLHSTPGGVFSGTLMSNQPVSMIRTSKSRLWAYVVSDADHRGWVRRSNLRRPAPQHP